MIIPKLIFLTMALSLLHFHNTYIQTLDCRMYTHSDTPHHI